MPIGEPDKTILYSRIGSILLNKGGQNLRFCPIEKKPGGTRLFFYLF